MIALRLDAPALRLLIDNNPELSLELQRAVLAEVVRHKIAPALKEALAKDASSAVGGMVSEMVADEAFQNTVARRLGSMVERADWASNRKALTKEARDKVEEELDKVLASMLKSRGSTIDLALQGLVEKIQEYTDTTLPDKIQAAIERYQADAIEKGVKERLDAIRNSLTAGA